MREELNKFAEEVYENAVIKGFNDDDVGRSLAENYGIWTANIHGETSELWEAVRNGTLEQPCDKAPAMIARGFDPLTNEEEELADIIIRALDTARARGIDIGRAVMVKHLYNKTREHKHGGKLA